MATIRVTHYGVEGEGATVKLAKEDAGRKIGETMRANARPRFFIAPTGAAMLWFEPRHGFLYIAAESAQALMERIARADYYGGSAGAERDDAEACARRQAAEYGLDASRPETYALACHYLRQFRDKQGAARIEDNLAFQLAYIAARHAAGAFAGTDDAWHRAACATSHEFRQAAADICAPIPMPSTVLA